MVKNSENINTILNKAYKVHFGLFTAYIFTEKQAKYVLKKNEYSLVLENEYCNPKTVT